MAATNLLPRILEQSLFNGVLCSLNGTNKMVQFTYVAFNPGTLTAELSISKTNKKLEVRDVTGTFLGTVQSIGMVGSSLGILSRRTVSRYLNHSEKSIYAPNLGINVFLQEVGAILTNFEAPTYVRKDSLVPQIVLPKP